MFYRPCFVWDAGLSVFWNTDNQQSDIGENWELELDWFQLDWFNWKKKEKENRSGTNENQI